MVGGSSVEWVSKMAPHILRTESQVYLPPIFRSVLGISNRDDELREGEFILLGFCCLIVVCSGVVCFLRGGDRSNVFFW